MDSRTYWKQREAEQLKYYITEEAEYQKHINDIYDYMMDQIQKASRCLMQRSVYRSWILRSMDGRLQSM